jgi:hypothetical protein
MGRYLYFVTASNEKTVLAEERTVLNGEKTDLSGGALGHTLPSVEVAPGDWMRDRRAGTWFFALFLAAVSLFFAVGAIAMPIAAEAQPGESLALRLLTEFMVIVVAVLAGALAARTFNAGLRISHQGVTLRGVLRTRHFSLVEVKRFVPATFSSGLARTEIGVKLERRGGYDLIVWAMRGGAPSSEAGLEEAMAGLQPLCAELNSLLYGMRGERVDPAKLAEERLTREAAETTYRRLRINLVLSAIGLFVVVAAMGALGSGLRPTNLVMAAFWALIGVPVALRSQRRALDEKVRTGEEEVRGSAAPKS